MIERDGDTVRLVQSPRALAVGSAVVIGFGVLATAFGVFTALGPLWGVSAYVEILAVIFIAIGVVTIVSTVRGGNVHDVLEIDATTLRLRRGDEILQSVGRKSISSLTHFVSEGASKTTTLITAYDDNHDIVAQWRMETAWSKKRFDEFLEATGIGDAVRR